MSVKEGKMHPFSYLSSGDPEMIILWEGKVPSLSVFAIQPCQFSDYLRNVAFQCIWSGSLRRNKDRDMSFRMVQGSDIKRKESLLQRREEGGRPWEEEEPGGGNNKTLWQG